MVPISNYDVYDSRMRKSLIDKAFFLDKTDFDVIVDYGCADGALIGMISSIFPEYTYIGYDNDPKMVSDAYGTMYHYHRDRDVDYFFHFEWERIAERVAAEQAAGKKVLLLLSSLIHEVYNYCTPDEQVEFWERVTKTGFDTIVVRDMAFNQVPTWAAPTNWVAAVREKADPKHLAEFEAEWGPIDRSWEFAHFLMKYRYGENWERELHEDYSPVTSYQVQNTIGDAGYERTFEEAFALPFNVRQIRKDFGFTFDAKTHYKLIFEKKQ